MSVLPDRYRGNASMLGAESMSKIRTAPILVVGAGGIGCELLKTLVLTGFENIEIIDLDTIDASNLNRQFLFRKGDVGKSKSECAQKAALPFNPLSKVKAYHGNIKDARFGAEFFSKFDLVINALDNLDARKHVNRMCVKADKPLIESGTRGYEGQVQPIQKGTYECYDCRPKTGAKTYAYCTIRAAPTQMVHCVAYAKVLYEHLFGNPDDDDDPVNFAEVKQQSEAAGENSEQLAARLFNKMHHTTINDLLNLKDKVWTTPKPTPTPLYDAFAAPASPGSSTAVGTGPEQAKLFSETLITLQGRGRVSFDKDDDEAMNFISAVSNLRAFVFGIPMQSLFDVKAVAGNIVPAIATTNAIISGTIVLEAIKILEGRINDCRWTFCGPVAKSFKRKPCILYPSPLDPPKEGCKSCGDVNTLDISLDTTVITLGFLVKDILQGDLSLAEPCVDGPGGGIYDCEVHVKGHPKLSKTLADVKITDGTQLIVSDDLQALEWEVTIHHKPNPDPSVFSVSGDTAAPAAEAAVTKPAADGGGNGGVAAADSDDDEIVSYVPKDTRREAAKRGSEAVRTEDKKRQKVDKDAETVIDLD